VVAGPESGGQSAGRGEAGRWMVVDRRMIRKLGGDVVAETRQTAPGTGGQESWSGTEGLGVLQESGEAGSWELLESLPYMGRSLYRQELI